MNQWLAVGTDYFNLYFCEDELVVAKVSSGRLGLIGALIGIPLYFIVFLITMKLGAMLDEKYGKGKCDVMADRLTEILAHPSAYKLTAYKYGQRVVIEKNDTCNSNNMGHKISIEGNEYFFDDFEMDIAREKFQKYFDVLPNAA